MLWTSSGNAFDQVAHQLVAARMLEAERAVDADARRTRSARCTLARSASASLGCTTTTSPPTAAFSAAGASSATSVPAIDDADAIAALGLLQVVRRQHDGHAVVVAQASADTEAVAARARIEPGTRLVEQQHGRPRQEPLRQLDAAREPAREALDQLAAPLGEAEALEQRGDALGEPGAAQPVEMPLVAQVLLHRELAVDARVLEHDADVTAHVARRRPHVVAVHARGAGTRRQQGRQDAEERALPAAVRPEQREELSLANVEGDARERLAFAVAPAQSLDLDGGAAHSGRRLRRSTASSAAVTRWSMLSQRLLE